MVGRCWCLRDVEGLLLLVISVSEHYGAALVDYDIVVINHFIDCCTFFPCQIKCEGCSRLEMSVFIAWKASSRGLGPDLVSTMVTAVLQKKFGSLFLLGGQEFEVHRIYIECKVVNTFNEFLVLSYSVQWRVP